jgi:hypothetical protein
VSVDRVRAATYPAALAVLTTLAFTLGFVGPVLGADPTATPGAGGDPRSPGEGPGFVGDPLLAIGGVLALAILSVLLTLAYVRLTERRGA